jgi:hypothetical protein
VDTWQRRTAYYTLGLLGVIVAYAVAYRYGMRTLEGESMTLLESFQVVVESVTTTGFGSDAPWRSPVMNVFVIVMNVTGVVAIFLALPVLLFPALEAALSTTVPAAVDGDRSDHVVVCSSYSPRVEALVSELDARGVDSVVVESDRATATERYETGHDVVHADPDSFDGLEQVGLPQARAVVSDVSDRVYRVGASYVLSLATVTGRMIAPACWTTKRCWCSTRGSGSSSGWRLGWLVRQSTGPRCGRTRGAPSSLSSATARRRPISLRTPKSLNETSSSSSAPTTELSVSPSSSYDVPRAIWFEYRRSLVSGLNDCHRPELGVIEQTPD